MMQAEEIYETFGIDNVGLSAISQYYRLSQPITGISFNLLNLNYNSTM
jgi:hypothetical protein